MVKIEFEVDNAAYRDGDGLLDLSAVAETIRYIASSVEDGFTRNNVFDDNGNCVGEYTVEED